MSGIFFFLLIHNENFSLGVFYGIFIFNKNTYLQSNTIVIPTLYFYRFISFHAWFGHKNTEPEKGEQKGSAILRDWFH